jgi:hypothetical protein
VNEESRLWIVTLLVAAVGGGTMIGAFRHMQGGFGPFNLRTVGIVLVATLAAVLGTLDTDTRTAAIGILGAVAGYLFGKDSRD